MSHAFTTTSLQRALQFLASQQAPSESRFAGAFACTLHQPNQPIPDSLDWTIFNTAATLLFLKDLPSSAAELPGVQAMSQARQFLYQSGLQTPVGSYGFWPPKATYSAEADLDDTALALLVLQAGDQNSSEAAWRLFAPYRYTAGMPLAMSSRWAAAFPGIFLTWMSGDSIHTPALIDAVAIAHVCRFLLEANQLAFPGLNASLTMLATVLTDALTPETTIPLAQLSPYYRSLPRLLAACAQLPTVCPEAVRVREAVKTSLAKHADSLFTNGSFDCCLWILTAQQACGLPVNASLLNELALGQQADGGWPEISLCTDAMGRWRWSSRTLATALATTLLSQHAAIDQISNQKASEKSLPDFSSAYDTAKELASLC